MKYYTGIGARATPPEICDLMTNLARKLEKENWILRSGGADGADRAFSNGVERNAEIYLPWAGFSPGLQLSKIHHKYIVVENDPEAEDSLKFHPSPHRLSQAGKKLMIRNFRQIIGKDTPNSKFVICWTADEAGEKGGTSQALRIARNFGIKIVNLRKEEDLLRIINFLKL